MSICRWHEIDSLANSVVKECSIGEEPQLLSPPPAPDPFIPSSVPPLELSTFQWITDTVTTTTPWLLLLGMLLYLVWEVWNVYTDYYGCEQICKFRNDEGPLWKNPGEHLLNNLQGSKAMLVDSLKRKDNLSDKEDLDMDDLTLRPRMVSRTDPNVLSVSRRLDFNDVPVMLRLRKHKAWTENNSPTYESGFVPRTVAKINSNNLADATFYNSQKDKFLFSDDEEDDKWLYKLWEDY